MDHVDFVTQQWEKERPDLDVSAMAVIGRVGRLAQAYQQGMQKTWARYDLNGAKFDVLATLRRSGAPYRLSPGDLLRSTMVSSGTMTNRIDRLEAAGLVSLSVNPDDSRSFLIGLTDKGLALIDEVATAHVQTQAELLTGLTQKEQAALNALLSKALQVASDD